MIIETERLYLREMNQADFKSLCKILQDEEVMYAYEGAFSDAEVQEWLDKQISRYKKWGFGLWAVILKETDEMIGQCGLTMQPWKDKQVLEIAGTNINYPVMHTPSNPQKYLNRNFYGEYSYSGTPFFDARCSADSTNLIIYGHHMNNGTMFADLCNYTDYSYFTEHPTVVLETKDGAFVYSVFSVMKVKSDDDWYKFLTTDLDKTYEKWVSYAKIKSLYNTEITPVCGQQILTLSTCYGDNQNDRILVLAVRN